MEVALFTKEENDDTLHLQHQGISVITINHLSLHTAIIDKNKIWYGSVSILGYHSVEDIQESRDCHESIGIYKIITLLDDLNQ